MAREVAHKNQNGNVLSLVRPWCSSLSCWKGATCAFFLGQQLSAIWRDRVTGCSMTRWFRDRYNSISNTNNNSLCSEASKARNIAGRAWEVQRQFEVAEQLQEEIQAAEEGKMIQENEEAAATAATRRKRKRNKEGRKRQQGGEEEVGQT
ncbi:hypothetical protein niasHT_010723 [Heterodera trifolii]|uniref:Uncharacterized protein n=1 Tax=Heterodera trifolii TaxID=157864 RepID=A0ABD2L6N4_9BILA